MTVLFPKMHQFSEKITARFFHLIIDFAGIFDILSLA